MTGTRIGRLAAWVLFTGLIAPASVWAEPIVAPEPCDGSAHAVRPYSRCHYWTPALYRLHACLHGPKPAFDTPDRYPDVPPRYQIIRYRCRAVAPAALTADRAIAP